MLSSFALMVCVRNEFIYHLWQIPGSLTLSWANEIKSPATNSERSLVLKSLFDGDVPRSHDGLTKLTWSALNISEIIVWMKVTYSSEQIYETTGFTREQIFQTYFTNLFKTENYWIPWSFYTQTWSRTVDCESNVTSNHWNETHFSVCKCI